MSAIIFSFTILNLKDNLRNYKLNKAIKIIPKTWIDKNINILSLHRFQFCYNLKITAVVIGCPQCSFLLYSHQRNNNMTSYFAHLQRRRPTGISTHKSREGNAMHSLLFPFSLL